ncbi:uncharacterized protein BDW43DRAFT_92497 [Aspergillus alliaceus]|uniref:uncharacterized protein n=1 Tax=Petromyces alliaceus TaxID=209559 RepID=UPI0012A3E0F3|nr:uncharacterized protein BDW43DRAFT_92497 [Aspergillus alliaceus]KAB8233033.1 hypothetical protein BDW43DRAFT_92497 [Aspergillus alliaceus]
MPPSSTPFRGPPSRRSDSSARPRAGPQFASTPRFVLLQQTPGHDADDLIDSQGSPQSTPVASTRAADQTTSGSTLRQKEIIEDSDDGLGYSGGAPDITGSVDLDSSAPDDTCDLDAEFEALFGPTTARAKRRRVSLDTRTRFTQRRKRNDDMVQTSSPELPSPSKGYTRGHSHTPAQTFPQRTVSVTTPLQPSTPGTIKPTFRHNPRFVLSASQAAPSTQPQSSARPTPALTYSTPRPKPTFVLPRSPSPSQAAEDPSAIPTPFSPSSQAVRRRGRHRPSTPSYLPGGMAAEVRGWILEMGTKRAQMELNQGRHTGAGVPDLQKYALAIRVTGVSQSTVGSSDPLAFVRGQAVTSLDGDHEGSPMKNVLLLGLPRYQPPQSLPQHPGADRVPVLAEGHVVGVYRGPSWEVDLGDGCDLRGVGSDGGGNGNSSGTIRWLVSLEWDLISVDY